MDSLFLDWVGRLAQEQRGALARVARAEGLAPEDAFDAVQEALHTFLGLPEARSLVDQPVPSGRLLATVTRNVARNRRRLHAVARPHSSDPEIVGELRDDGASVEELVAAAEDQLRLSGCLENLDEIPRAVVTLRMLEELPGQDVATILGLTPGHVAVLLHRAKASLLACMTAEPPCGPAV